jgi:hypothetical protein
MPFGANKHDDHKNKNGEMGFGVEARQSDEQKPRYK